MSVILGSWLLWYTRVKCNLFPFFTISVSKVEEAFPTATTQNYHLGKVEEVAAVKGRENHFSWQFCGGGK